MSDAFTALVPWIRDVALAYAGGLVLGAPIATLVTWVTGIERMATWCLLVAMAVVLRVLRQHRRTSALHGAATPCRHASRTTASVAGHAA